MTVRYYILDSKNKRKDMFIAYSDIGAEFGVSRNSVAGKFYRAFHEKKTNVIEINGTKIERVYIN